MASCRLLVVCSLLGALTACAGRGTASSPIRVEPPPQTGAIVHQPIPVPSISPEDALRARVKAFWDARVKGDVALQYDFLEPEGRERVTLTGYVRSRGVITFRGYEIKALHLVEEKAWVRVLHTFQVNLPELARFGPKSQTNWEVWVLRGGIWYRPYSQKDAEHPPPGVAAE